MVVNAVACAVYEMTSNTGFYCSFVGWTKESCGCVCVCVCVCLRCICMGDVCPEHFLNDTSPKERHWIRCLPAHDAGTQDQSEGHGDVCPEHFLNDTSPTERHWIRCLPAHDAGTQDQSEGHGDVCPEHCRVRLGRHGPLELIFGGIANNSTDKSHATTKSR